jgi:hypothetical protein
MARVTEKATLNEGRDLLRDTLTVPCRPGSSRQSKKGGDMSVGILLGNGHLITSRNLATPYRASPLDLTRHQLKQMGMLGF